MDDNQIIDIIVFNVGKADNLLIKFSSGTWGLIDFYYHSPQKEPPSLTYLKQIKGPVVIEFVHISHYHHDHTKGFDKFMKWVSQEKDRVSLKHIWLPGMFPVELLKSTIDSFVENNKDIAAQMTANNTTGEYKEITHKFSFLNFQIEQLTPRKKIKTLTSLQVIPVNDAFSLICLWPASTTGSEIADKYVSYLNNYLNGVVTRAPYHDPNSLSTILAFCWTDGEKPCKKFVFGGDATKNDWINALEEYSAGKKHFMPHYQDLTTEFIKASHHGSRHSSDVQIWDVLLPVDNNAVVEIFFTASGGEFPHHETIDHILEICKKNNRLANLHYEENPNCSYSYEEEYFQVQRNENINYTTKFPGLRVPNKTKPFFGYKYVYNGNSESSRIVKLIAE